MRTLITQKEKQNSEKVNLDAIKTNGTRHTESNGKRSYQPQTEATNSGFDPITNKLKEIRKQVSRDMPTSKQRTTIENSINKHMKEGLSMEEAIEYEANLNRKKQLEEKMMKKYNESSSENQYYASKHNKHVK